MVFIFIWLAAAAGLFWWNQGHVPFIGIRFTEKIFGAPLGGEWLCLAIAAYCVVREIVRRRRSRRP